MSEWQPVEMAPHNCDLLIFCPHAETKIMIGRLSGGRCADWYEQDCYGRLNGEPLDVEVFAWMPLPEPPGVPGVP
jgi:hypothetical protein